MKQIKIGLVDDEPNERKLICHFLKTDKSFKLLFEATNGGDLLFKLNHHNPDIILLDLYMPLMDGFEVLEVLKQKTECKVLCLSNHLTQRVINQLKELNVDGYCLKKPIFIREGINSIINNTSFYPALNALPIIKYSEVKSVPFTGVEIEILNGLASGLSYKEMGENYIQHLTIKTIEIYTQNMIKRLSLKNRAHLVSYAYAHGLIKEINWD